MPIILQTLEKIVRDAYQSHNDFIENECRLLGLSAAAITQRKAAFCLYLSDCELVASFIFKHLKEGHRLKLFKPPTPAERKRIKDVKKLRKADAVDTSAFQQTPLNGLFFKKIPNFGLSNSIIVFSKGDDILHILVKPRINYSDPYNAEFVRTGKYKVIKPLGLMIQLALDGTGERIFSQSFPIVTWARTTQDPEISSAATGAPPPVSNPRLSRGQKLTFLSDPAHSLNSDIRAFERIDYQTHRSVPDPERGTAPERGTIFYQEYYGIDLTELIQVDCYKAPTIFTPQFKCRMIFSFLESLLAIFERGEWPSDIKLQNVCAILMPNDSLKCTVIDYLPRDAVTDSLFKRNPANAINPRWRLIHYAPLLARVRDKDHDYFEAGHLDDWYQMRHELIFEIFCTIYLMSLWPHVCRINSASADFRFHIEPCDWDKNRMFFIVLHGAEIRVDSRFWDTKDAENQIRFAFEEFLYALFLGQNTCFYDFLKSLHVTNVVARREDWTASPVGLPWPQEFNEAWIIRFSNIVDRFALSPIPPMTQ